MKYFKWFLKISGFLFFLLVVLILVKRYPRTDTFFIEKSQIKDISYLRKLDIVNVSAPAQHTPDRNHANYPTKVHEIEKGSQITFGYRVFQDVIPLAIDDEIFEKLTFSVEKKLVEDQTFVLPDSNIKIVYSSGGAAWPEDGCHSYPTSGKINIKKVTDTKFSVMVDMNVKCIPSSLNPLQSDVSVKFHEEFEEISFEDLNPYLGSIANFPYASTYR